MQWAVYVPEQVTREEVGVKHPFQSGELRPPATRGQLHGLLLSGPRV